MSKAHDDINPQGLGAPAPANTFPGAAEPNFSTYPADQKTGMIHPPFPDEAREYVPSRRETIPERVSAAEVARECTSRGNQPWSADDPAGGPILAGTRTVADDLPGKRKSIGASILADGKRKDDEVEIL